MFDDKTKSIYFYCNNLSHNNSNIVRFLMTGASDLISNSAHFFFTTSTGHMILNISGIFKSILKDQYKCPACDKKINPRSVKKSNPIDKSLNNNLEQHYYTNTVIRSLGSLKKPTRGSRH